MMMPQMFRRSAALRMTFIVVAAMLLAGCSEDKPKQKSEKDNRSAQEKVLILKQRFQQLESSLDDMQRDLEIQKKQIESTREIVKSIRHSLVKGGLKGYNLDNVSTTDPLVLNAVALQKERDQNKVKKEEEKKASENRLFNGLLLFIFFLIVVALFVVSLKDKKPGDNPSSEVMTGGDPLAPSSGAATASAPGVAPPADASPAPAEPESYGELRPNRPDDVVDEDEGADDLGGPHP